MGLTFQKPIAVMSYGEQEINCSGNINVNDDSFTVRFPYKFTIDDPMLGQFPVYITAYRLLNNGTWEEKDYTDEVGWWAAESFGDINITGLVTGNTQQYYFLICYDKQCLASNDPIFSCGFSLNKQVPVPIIPIDPLNPPVVPLIPPTTEEKDNTMLYVGGGIIAVLLLLLLFKRKKEK